MPDIIHNPKRTLLTTDEDIEVEAVQYFVDLFASSPSPYNFEEKLITKHLDKDEIRMLDDLFTKEKVVRDINICIHIKLPG